MYHLKGGENTDNLDEFINKISRGQDTSYGDINVTSDTNTNVNTSAAQTVTEGKVICSYNRGDTNYNLPTKKN